MNWRHLPPPARPVAAAADRAVGAVRARDTDELDAAVAALAALDPAAVGLVLGTVVRLAMEEAHPDGLDGDDVRTVLTDTVREWPDADPYVLLVVLAGALGMHDTEADTPTPKPDALARHAALLVGHLLGERPFPPHVDRAVQEIERTQLND